MNYLTLEDIHRQLRLEPDFTEDDELLEIYGDSAENFIEQHLNRALDDIAAENGGELPKNVINSMLMFVDYMYDNSGSGDVKEIPNSIWILLTPLKKYTIM